MTPREHELVRQRALRHGDRFKQLRSWGMAACDGYKQLLVICFCAAVLDCATRQRGTPTVAVLLLGTLWFLGVDLCCLGVARYHLRQLKTCCRRLGLEDVR